MILNSPYEFLCAYVLPCLGRAGQKLLLHVCPSLVPGMRIVDLSVPGVNVAVTKRPYDLDLHLLVQDLCLVDRIQTFGPEYELVVCSSGKSILSSPFGEPPTKRPKTIDHRSQSCPDFNSLGPRGTSPERHVQAAAKDDSHMEANCAPTDIFSATLVGDPSDALLSLSYSRLDPYSPLHPAAKDTGWEEKDPVDREAAIQNVNVKCTAVDAIGECH